MKWISLIVISIAGATLIGGTGALAHMSPTLTTASKCHYRDHRALPDRSCTPGALNPDVKQSTIKKTICKKGWTKTVRPPESVTKPQKLRSMDQYGVSDPTKFEYDHLVPLELGGATDSTKNLWPEPHKTSNNLGSYVKDGRENHIKYLVCNGAMKLSKAQRIFTRNWTLALNY